MGYQVDRLVALLQVSKDHRRSWKAAERRSQSTKQSMSSDAIMVTGGILAFAGALLLIIAFCSPNWMESRLHAYSEFVKLGLWEVCFNNYFHHSFQFHYAFSGCHWVYSREYRIIWEFILPPWFLAVQGLTTVSLIMSILSSIFLATIFLNFVRNSHRAFLRITIVQHLCTAVFLLTAIILFGIKAQDQRWMPHQLYNYYSWSFWLTFISILFHTVSAFIFIQTLRKVSPTPIMFVPTNIPPSISQPKTERV